MADGKPQVTHASAWAEVAAAAGAARGADTVGSGGPGHDHPRRQ
jgi:hypothetical protein